MTTPNERELAQLEREEQERQAEFALVVVEVAGRREDGSIEQYRGFREATEADLLASGWVKR